MEMKGVQQKGKELGPISTCDKIRCDIIQYDTIISLSDDVSTTLYSRYCTLGTVLQILYSRYFTLVTVLQVLYCRYCTLGTLVQVLQSRYFTLGTLLQVLYSRYCTLPEATKVTVSSFHPQPPVRSEPSTHLPPRVPPTPYHIQIKQPINCGQKYFWIIFMIRLVHGQNICYV